MVELLRLSTQEFIIFSLSFCVFEIFLKMKVF